MPSVRVKSIDVEIDLFDASCDHTSAQPVFTTRMLYVESPTLNKLISLSMSRYCISLSTVTFLSSLYPRYRCSSLIHEGKTANVSRRKCRHRSIDAETQTVQSAVRLHIHRINCYIHICISSGTILLTHM